MYKKTIIAPLVALFALIVGAVFHIQVDDDLQGVIIESVAALVSVGFTLYGIIKNHKE